MTWYPMTPVPAHTSRILASLLSPRYVSISVAYALPSQPNNLTSCQHDPDIPVSQRCICNLFILYRF